MLVKFPVNSVYSASITVPRATKLQIKDCCPIFLMKNNYYCHYTTTTTTKNPNPKRERTTKTQMNFFRERKWLLLLLLKMNRLSEFMCARGENFVFAQRGSKIVAFFVSCCLANSYPPNSGELTEMPRYLSCLNFEFLNALTYFTIKKSVCVRQSLIYSRRSNIIFLYYDKKIFYVICFLKACFRKK